MKIRQLTALGRDLSSTDWLAVDTGDRTAKISGSQVIASFSNTLEGLVSAHSISTTGSVVLSSGRSFGDYTLIVCMWNVQSGSTWWTRATAIYPAAFSNLHLEMSYEDSVGNHYWLGVERADATHVTISKSTNATGQLYIWGVK